MGDLAIKTLEMWRVSILCAARLNKGLKFCNKVIGYSPYNVIREYTNKSIRFLLEAAIQKKNVQILDGVLAEITSNKYAVNGIDCYQLCKAYVDLSQIEKAIKVLGCIESHGIPFNSII